MLTFRPSHCAVAEELTPQKVKKLMEGVIRKHLGYLVMWGAVGGGVIGCISQLAGFGV